MKVFQAIAASSLLVGVSQGAGYPKIAGYQPASDVVPHSKIDLDQYDFGQALKNADYETAKSIYTEGKYSTKSSGFRTLQGFANQKAADKFRALNEELFLTYAEYWASDTFADDFVLACLENTGHCKDKAAVYREECANKGSAYRNIYMYVAHEMYDAIADCNKLTQLDNDNGVHAWDEAWAFYAGSKEGTDGTGSGASVYALAEKRCTNYGTCDSTGRAAVNNKLLKLFQDGLAEFNVLSEIKRENCDNAEKLMEEILQLMPIPLIQGTMRYAYRLNGMTKADRDKNWKYIAEGLTFASGVLPAIAAVDPAAAKVIRQNMYDITDDTVVDYKAVRDAFESSYAKMGITCEDIGLLEEAKDDVLSQGGVCGTETPPTEAPFGAAMSTVAKPFVAATCAAASMAAYLLF